MFTNVDKLELKSSVNFVCEKCNYFTSRKSQFDRHILTSKHQNVDKMLTNVDILELKSSVAYYGNEDLFIDEKSVDSVKKSSTAKQTDNLSIINCICGRSFSHRQSLYVHKKKCIVLKGTETMEENEPITKELVVQLIKQNQKLQDMLYEQSNKMFDLAKDGKNINSNNTTNNNTQFNLNFFLNEQCKDALNLTDFVDSLNVKLKDLEYTAKTGYAEGISNIFIKALSDLNVHIRPLHCSDSKREIIYIKENGEWNKDDENKSKLTKAIKIVGSKNIKQITEWQKANPDYMNPSSKQNDRYMKMLCNVMSGSTKEESEKNYEKIIRKIAKEVVIDKGR
jgi:hypothetical protein